MTFQSARLLRRLLVVGVVVLFSLWLVSGALAALPTDTTIADFNLGDIGSCYVGPSSSDGLDGEVVLAPAFSADFADGNLPTGWLTHAWQTGGSATVANGVMTVNNAVISGSLTSAPASIEYMVMFANALDQNAGFYNLNASMDDFAPPWAFYGSWYLAPPTLHARTYDGSVATNTEVGTSYLGGWHRFRVDWTAAGVAYSVDDVVVDNQSAVLSDMHPMFSDNGQESIQVDWLRMGPYAPTSCTYTSRLFDSGITNPIWTTLLTGVYVPSNTTLIFETRSGNTADTNDTSWSAWQAVSGGAIASPGRRYLQYRAVLATSDTLTTPRIYSVQPQGETTTAVTVTGLTGRPATQGAGVGGFLLAAGLGVPALILLGSRIRKVRRLHH